MSGPRLQMRGIRKAFSGVAALSDGCLSVQSGEIHALMGANGAGKSTLMNILGGVHLADAGSIRIDGQDVSINDSKASKALGIAFVHQELTMLPSMTVAENIFIDDLPLSTLGLVDHAKMHLRSRELLDRVGCKVQTSCTVDELSTGERQLVEIARALKSNPRIFILDEPTSSLSGPERNFLFGVARSIRDSGAAVIYISHFLDEVFDLCDAVTVMRNGRFISQTATADTTIDAVLKDMLGQIEETTRVRPPHVSMRPPCLTVKGLFRQNVLHDIHFELRPGEITGLWGLLGSGRTELVRALMGLDAIDGGELSVRQGSQLRQVSQAKLRSLTGLVTEDRRGEGLLLPLSIARNLSLPNQQAIRGRTGLLNERQEAAMCQSLIQRLSIKAADGDQAVGTLSGGNQQKVVFARWLYMKPDLFILDEPTRGLDVGAKTEILKMTVELASAGAAVLLISSELEEIMRVSDRYLVINRGRITAEHSGDASKDTLMGAISEQAPRTIEAVA